MPLGMVPDCRMRCPRPFKRSWSKFMIFFSDKTYFFLFLVSLGLLGFFTASFRWKEKLFQSLGDPHVLKRLTDPLSSRYQRVKAFFLILASLFFVLTLAGPRWGQQYQEVHRKGIDVIVAVDVSASMLAEDIKPNRLTQAKRELSLLINGLQGDRIGLVAFAGAAFLQCPLTLDYGAARSLLDLIDPSLIPSLGTSLSSAIHTACNAFEKGETKHKALVLLTDGEDHSQKLPDAVKRAKEEGVHVFAIGFGKREGEIIPIRDSQGNIKAYKKDKSGQTVVSKLDEQSLRDMAAKTNGQYYRASQGEIEVERILNDISRMEKKSLESRVYGQYENKYQIPLIIVFILLLLEFLWPEAQNHWKWVMEKAKIKEPGSKGRQKKDKSYILSLFLFALCPLLLAAPAYAMGRTPSKKDITRALEQSKAEIEKNPADPKAQFNLGNALYLNKDFEGAANAYDKTQELTQDLFFQSKTAYNRGNAFFRQNKIKEAIENYKQSLRLDPADEDAKHNLEFAQMVLKAQKQPQKNNKQNKDDSDKDKEKDKAGQQNQPGQKEDPQDKAPQLQEGMTKEDAARLLQAIEQEEKQAREKMKANQPKKKAMEQDW